MNKILYKLQFIAYIFLATLLASCDLNFENTEAINPDNVWKDKKMINAFLVDIYGELTPGWPLKAGAVSDEGMNSGGNNMDDFLRGVIDVETTSKDRNFDYAKIEKINFFLDNLSDVSEKVLSVEEKQQLQGQALFWRAWAYWNMVHQFGGVPLILHAQDATDNSSLFVPRNKTSECMAQIFKDLDDAISLLPAQWNDANYGRIDKGVSMAFKGRVMLWYASPLFNPSNDITRWENAYKVNLEAVKHLQGLGKGLFEDYKELWYKEQNKEVVMVNQFYYSDHTYNPNHVRPEVLSKDEADGDQPYLPLLMAYPKRDGSTLALDINRLSDPVYNQQFMSEFYDRDDRFESTIFCGGTIYPTPEEELKGGYRFWNVWTYADKSTALVSMAAPQFPGRPVRVNTGYNQLKAVDRKDNRDNVGYAAKDWIEIRFAEVLMNMGECANELGKSSQALQVLYDIRKRAGIVSTDGSYGIKAVSQVEIREAYIKERQVEFAFEGRRFGDLRRLKRFDIINKQVHRATIAPLLKDREDLEDFDFKSDIKDPSVQKMFTMHYVANLDGNPDQKFNLSEKHWFFPVSKKDLDRNSKLEQNNEWGGTFDPLK